MQSMPGIQLRGGDRPSRVLCESCGDAVAVMPPGVRVVFKASGDEPTGHLVGECKCGKAFNIPTIESPRV